MTLVSIVVPVYNALEYARACVDSIYTCRTEIAFEVIAVDNGSDRAVGVWAEEQRDTRAKFHSLRFEQPLGFARAMNEGAAVARGDYLVLLNSDTLVTDGWLDRMAAALSGDSTLGIVGPVTNRCGHDIQQDRDSLSLFSEEAQQYADRIAGREMVYEPQRLVFFCATMRREVWEVLGGLDAVFGSGNFEDDDFCLRARLAGYRLAVHRGVFVFHNEGKTFLANEIDHAEMLARNRSIFGRRAAAWTRSPRTKALGQQASSLSGNSISVLVAVTAERVGGLRETLASLTNQTLAGFKTVVVSPAGIDVSPILAEFSTILRIEAHQLEDGDAGGEADLWNMALSSTDGDWIAYLPAGDIFYPFHLEVLLSAALRSNRHAVYSAWSVVVAEASGERREVVEFFESVPDLELGDWAPLSCWMHDRDAAAGLRFDAAFGGFCAWAFAIQLNRLVRPLYLCRVTWERTPDRLTSHDEEDSAAVMCAFPVESAARQAQRGHFLDAVRKGVWEKHLIVIRNEKVRRARRMLQRQGATLGEAALYAGLRARLKTAYEASPVVPPNLARPDIILFSIIEWKTLTQRPHHFAELLAARGHRVFWVDPRLRPVREVDVGNLAVHLKPGIDHVVLPGGAEFIYRLPWSPDSLQGMVDCIDHLRFAYGIAAAIQLVNFPRWEPLNTRLAERFGWRIAYDCLDNQAAFADLFGHALGDSESRLVTESATVVTSSTVLHEQLRHLRPDAVLIPNGVDVATFGDALSAGLLDHLQRPIAGFFGAFADWLDLDWIEAAARRFPTYAFVYIGCDSFSMEATRRRWKQLAAMPNIHVFGQVDPHTLSQYLAQFDVCLMPFRDLAMTRSMNAVKIYEYLATGKPVLARDLPETSPLAAAGLVSTYTTHEESFSLLERLIAEATSEDRIAARKTFASSNTWGHRVAALCQALGL